MQSGHVLAGRYRLTRPLASGGMGQVWVAYDETLGREVAVKVQSLTDGEDSPAVQRFRREARATAALQHPHVVTIYDTGTQEGVAFIVMELLSGPTVGQLIADGPMDQERVREIASQVASGLAAAHAAGVVHRDIKPSNLVLDAHDRIKIVDFGIARLTADTEPLTATNMMIGTAAYLSPEQVAGDAADERSDLYSLGCVITAMLTGRPPFAAEHPVAVAHQHLNVQAPSVLDRRADADPVLTVLVEDLLAKDPALRPQTAEEVLHRLSRTGAVEPTRPISVQGTQPMPRPEDGERDPRRAAAPVAAGTAMAGAGSAFQKRSATSPPARRSRPWWLLALLGLAVVVAAAAVLTQLDNRTDAPSVTEADDGPSTSESATGVQETTAEEPSPSTDAEPPPTETTEPGPTETEDPAPEAPLDEARTALQSAIDAGDVDAGAAEELAQKLDDLQRKVDTGQGPPVEKQVADLDEQMQKLVDEGRLDPDVASQIMTAVRRLG